MLREIWKIVNGRRCLLRCNERRRESACWWVVFDQEPKRVAVGSGIARTEGGSLLPALSLFIHVLDRRLIDHQIRCADAVYLDAGLVIPLDGSVDFFIVEHDDYHWSLRLHLLLKIEIFGIGLFRRR